MKRVDRLAPHTDHDTQLPCGGAPGSGQMRDNTERGGEVVAVDWARGGRSGRTNRRGS
jgi:hypothetical protein